MTISTYPPQHAAVPMKIAEGGTSATTAAQARTNLELGSMAQQDAHAVAITGGSATGLTSLQVLAAGATTHILGTLGVGTPPHAGRVINLVFRKDLQDGMIMQPSVTDTMGGGNITFMNVAGTIIGRISTDATTTTYATTSDVRLKTAIEKLVGSLDVIRVLNPVSFLWKATDAYGEGFRADELQQVIPQAVTGEPDALNEDGSIRPQGVDYGKLVPRLVGAIQELLVRVEALEARLV